MDIDAGTRVAIVGETGSGKSTFAKLLTRLMDPVRGGGAARRRRRPRHRARRSLRRSVVLVPQEGFLFDDTIAANVRYGRLDATEDDILASADELGLGDWVAGLPRGLDTTVGQRGESLSAGERQLVALLRAHLADPDLLVLDEATSAVDPALEMRIGRALERLMSGRTSVTIAHRLSTAENADEVVVVDRGRIVQRGPHAELVGQDGRLRRPARLVGGPAGLTVDPGYWTTVTSLDPAIAARLKRNRRRAGARRRAAARHRRGADARLDGRRGAGPHPRRPAGRRTGAASRQEYWVKGETSGHRQWVKEVRLDCDGDTLLVKVDQEGPACHTGDRTCFDADLPLDRCADALSPAEARSARSCCSASAPRRPGGAWPAAAPGSSASDAATAGSGPAARHGRGRARCRSRPR